MNPIRVPHGPEENHGNTYQPWYDRNLSKKSYCCSEGCLKWNGSIWKVLFTNMFWDSSSYPLYVISFHEFVLYFLEDVNIFCSHITKRIKPWNNCFYVEEIIKMEQRWLGWRILTRIINGYKILVCHDREA